MYRFHARRTRSEPKCRSASILDQTLSASVHTSTLPGHFGSFVPTWPALLKLFAGKQLLWIWNWWDRLKKVLWKCMYMWQFFALGCLFFINVHTWLWTLIICKQFYKKLFLFKLNNSDNSNSNNQRLYFRLLKNKCMKYCQNVWKVFKHLIFFLWKLSFE